jgi:hypothetical protein
MLHSERLKRQLLGFLLGIGVGFGLSSIASLALPPHAPREPAAIVWQLGAGAPGSAGGYCCPGSSCPHNRGSRA